jgi:hypothetical protein
MSLGALKRFVDGPPPPPPAEERCELCREPIRADHGHVVNVETRRLLCACRACYLLFVPRGAAAGKIRAVPDRYRTDPDLRLDEAMWARLQIPVRTAFFFTSSPLGKAVAFYPSPAGATEAQLDPAAWAELTARHASLAGLEPDVEALLVHGPRGAGLECFLVPIHACYELVGRVRTTWRGFDGGEEAWQAIDAFFTALRARCAEAPP